MQGANAWLLQGNCLALSQIAERLSRKNPLLKPCLTAWLLFFITLGLLCIYQSFTFAEKKSNEQRIESTGRLEYDT
jgi:hypothetical protein